MHVTHDARYYIEWNLCNFEYFIILAYNFKYFVILLVTSSALLFSLVTSSALLNISTSKEPQYRTLNPRNRLWYAIIVLLKNYDPD